MEDSGDLYDTPEKARAEGPKEWAFDESAEPGKTTGWTADESRFTSTKLYPVVRWLKDHSSAQNQEVLYISSQARYARVDHSVRCQRGKRGG